MSDIDPLLTEHGQHVHKEYSKWSLMDKIYEAKKNYYGPSSTKLSDSEYDAIETSFKAIHGESAFKELYCVGYDAHKHGIIKMKLLRYEIETLEVCKARGMVTPQLEEKKKEYIRKYG